MSTNNINALHTKLKAVVKIKLVKGEKSGVHRI